VQSLHTTVVEIFLK